MAERKGFEPLVPCGYTRFPVVHLRPARSPLRVCRFGGGSPRYMDSPRESKAESKRTSSGLSSPCHAQLPRHTQQRVGTDSVAGAECQEGICIVTGSRLDRWSPSKAPVSLSLGKTPHCCANSLTVAFPPGRSTAAARFPENRGPCMPGHVIVFMPNNIE